MTYKKSSLKWGVGFCQIIAAEPFPQFKAYFNLSGGAQSKKTFGSLNGTCCLETEVTVSIAIKVVGLEQI